MSMDVCMRSRGIAERFDFRQNAGGMQGLLRGNVEHGQSRLGIDCSGRRSKGLFHKAF